MKEAIGGTWIYGIVLVFIAVFATFVSVSTNYSRCFRIKDEIVLMIEHYKGVNEQSTEAIYNYLSGIAYNSTGKCPEDGGEWEGFTLDGSATGYGTGDAAYCIQKHDLVTRTSNTAVADGPIGHPERAYYSVAVFFKLDWPILRQIFTITISGETAVVQLPYDTKLSS